MTDGERNGARVSREFDYPRELVFSMFIEPKKAARFWGPEGSTNLAFELDPRRGGAIRIVDRNRKGVIGNTSGTILDIVVPELLVFRSATSFPEGATPWEALQTMRFEELGPQRSRVTVVVQVLAAGSFPGGVESLEGAYLGGWGETFDRLQRGLR